MPKKVKARPVEIPMGLPFRCSDGGTRTLPTHVNAGSYKEQIEGQQIIARALADKLQRGRGLNEQEAWWAAQALFEYANALPSLRAPKAKKGQAPKFDPGTAALSVAVLMARKRLGLTEASDCVADEIGVSGVAVRERIKPYMEAAEAQLALAQLADGLT